MQRVFCESMDRDASLKSILQIEQFYNDQENLDRTTRERYLSGRKKHHRRCANEIERSLPCPYAKCNKAYSSEGALNLHIKIKHNGGNKTDREKIAKSIVYHQANGMEIHPEIEIQVNLPPGLIKKAAAQIGVSLDDTSITKLEDVVIQRNEEKRLQQKKEELIKAQKYPVESMDFDAADK